MSEVPHLIPMSRLRIGWFATSLVLYAIVAVVPVVAEWSPFPDRIWIYSPWVGFCVLLIMSMGMSFDFKKRPVWKRIGVVLVGMIVYLLVLQPVLYWAVSALTGNALDELTLGRALLDAVAGVPCVRYSLRSMDFMAVQD